MPHRLLNFRSGFLFLKMEARKKLCRILGFGESVELGLRIVDHMVFLRPASRRVSLYKMTHSLSPGALAGEIEKQKLLKLYS
jgi:hypothetical protein